MIESGSLQTAWHSFSLHPGSTISFPALSIHRATSYDPLTKYDITATVLTAAWLSLCRESLCCPWYELRPGQSSDKRKEIGKLGAGSSSLQLKKKHGGHIQGAGSMQLCDHHPCSCKSLFTCTKMTRCFDSFWGCLRRVSAWALWCVSWMCDKACVYERGRRNAEKPRGGFPLKGNAFLLPLSDKLLLPSSQPRSPDAQRKPGSEGEVKEELEDQQAALELSEARRQCARRMALASLIPQLRQLTVMWMYFSRLPLLMF